MQARHILRTLIVCCMLLTLPGCGDSSPILIGFAGQLTGKSADLGVHGRNGAMLAIEKINESGGINGRPLQLITVDDGNTPEGAIEAGRELVDKGVVAVIGHMTSSQTVAALPFINQHDIVMVSPTTSTPELTGKVDSFFRLIVENGIRGRALADYARSALDVDTVVTIAESDNRSYSFTLVETFGRRFTEFGGALVGSLRYSSSDSTGWDHIVDTVIQLKPQAVMLACPAQDAVSILQRLHAAGLHPQVLSGGWAYTDNLLLWGGGHVEDMVFVIDYAADNPNPNFIKFRELYRNRFGSSPIFPSAFAYESVLALAEGLKKTNGSANGLADAMAPSKTIQGVVGPFKLNEFGDVERNFFVVTVQNGQFRTVEMR